MLIQYPQGLCRPPIREPLSTGTEAFNDDERSAGVAHDIEFFTFRILLEGSRRRHRLQNDHGDFLRGDTFTHEMVGDAKASVLCISDRSTIRAERGRSGNIRLQSQIRFRHRRREILTTTNSGGQGILERRDTQSPDWLLKHRQMATQLTKDDAIGHDGDGAVERRDAVAYLQLVGLGRALVVEKQHDDVVAFDLLGDHHVDSFVPAALDGFVHELDGGLVDLEGTEPLGLVEGEIHFEAGEAGEIDECVGQAGWAGGGIISVGCFEGEGRLEY